RESSAGHWTGVLAGRVWTLRQTEEQLWYTVHEEEEEEEGSRTEATGQELQPRGRDAAGSLHPEAPAREASGGADSWEARQILRDYFRLDVGLAGLYQAWAAVDPHFQKVAANFPGTWCRAAGAEGCAGERSPGSRTGTGAMSPGGFGLPAVCTPGCRGLALGTDPGVHTAATVS
ncbi:8-oxoguanine DNA glycosylase, partial [Chelydra serpentina]